MDRGGVYDVVDEILLTRKGGLEVTSQRTDSVFVFHNDLFVTFTVR